MLPGLTWGGEMRRQGWSVRLRRWSVQYLSARLVRGRETGDRYWARRIRAAERVVMGVGRG